ncbi:hypothetical protein SDRG_12526 [Saprolegnia diclina VS20]|uniref:Uncharacterized protein n=1 Tax=Saprolegnia diclina (strain VS20) TaxID=1156394 RepID=T0Q8E9_SAPDV|nr:hypothetical protein SDRG_12526 [Saprolegnia diclina VS20]EQC29755.1 hypothetical protein SDRG_12526 [Saprolegnia diclina VS20]|eukprot:XP_008616821.1 hypothetical protein SDRG_12526 [Saprolegnia diclina VS20]
MPLAMTTPRTRLSDDRKRHVYMIAQLLNDSASKAPLPPHARSKKVLRLALKMEQKLFDATHGRKLSDTSIQKYLVVLAARACKSWVRTVPM